MTLRLLTKDMAILLLLLLLSLVRPGLLPTVVDITGTILARLPLTREVDRHLRLQITGDTITAVHLRMDGAGAHLRLTTLREHPMTIVAWDLLQELIHITSLPIILIRVFNGRRPISTRHVFKVQVALLVVLERIGISRQIPSSHLLRLPLLVKQEKARKTFHQPKHHLVEVGKQATRHQIAGACPAPKAPC